MNVIEDEKTTTEAAIKYVFIKVRVNTFTSNQRFRMDSDYILTVISKVDISVGMYACGIIEYKCSKCCHRAVKLSIFLPVRDQEKPEDVYLFENGELDDFLRL